MAKDKGMTTAEFAKYYQSKRHELMEISPEEAAKEEVGTLGQEMDKLIEAANSRASAEQQSPLL